MYAAIGRHPNEATGFDDADLAELQGARRPREVRRDRRDRPRLLPRLRAPRRPGAGVPRPDRARARDRQAARDPHPRRRGRHARDADRATPAACAVILHCFSMPEPHRGVPRPRGLVDLVRRQRHLSQGRAICARRRSASRRAAAGRDRCAVPVAAARARQAQPARQRGPHRAGAGASSAGSSYEELEQAGGRARQRPRCFGWCKLGQNFLVDRNILDVIERLADARARRRRARDRRRSGHALRAAGRSESRHRARRRDRPHARARGCARLLGAFANVALHIGDALELDLAALRPPPDEGRRQPALRDRRDGDSADDRGAAERSAAGS